MSNAVKMSDVFRGRDIAAYGCNLVDRNVDRSDLGKLGTNGMAKAAAHAINQHDALVAMNAELVEALSGLLKTDYMSIEDKDRYRVVVAKAKELTK